MRALFAVSHASMFVASKSGSIVWTQLVRYLKNVSARHVGRELGRLRVAAVHVKSRSSRLQDSKRSSSPWVSPLGWEWSFGDTPDFRPRITPIATIIPSSIKQTNGMAHFDRVSLTLGSSSGNKMFGGASRGTMLSLFIMS